jgi:hypothetical protein
MTIVKDKLKLRLEAETARKVAEKTLEDQKASTTAATPGPKGPEIAVPDKFDGTRGVKAKVYANQIGLYVVSNPSLFPDDRSKIIFSLSYLTGQASAWAQPITQRIFAGEEMGYKEFSVAFQAMYFDTKKKSRAEKALRALKQTKTVAQYTHTFTVHAHDSGWEARTLVSQYTQGLKKDVQLALVLAQTEFVTLAEVSQLALKIDNKINGANAVRLKSVSKNLLLNGEGDDGGASSALLYYQKNKTTKFAWQFIYSDRNG